MVRQVVTLLTDDVDGGEADHTVEFGTRLALSASEGPVWA
jgi:hypothetical protein